MAPRTLGLTLVAVILRYATGSSVSYHDTDYTAGGPVQSYVQKSSNGLEAIGVSFPLELVYNTTLAKSVFNNTVLTECFPTPAAFEARFCTDYPEPITLAFPALPNLPFVNVQLFMLSKGAFMPTVYANYRLRTALFQAAFNLYDEEEMHMFDGTGLCMQKPPDVFYKSTMPIPADCFPGGANVRQSGLSIPLQSTLLIDYNGPEWNNVPSNSKVRVVDPSSPRFNHTLHYSAFNGSLNAYLPLVSGEWLEEQFPDSCFPMPGVLQNAPEAGLYPDTYCVFVDEEEVRIELRNFTYKNGTCTAPPAPGSYFIELPHPMPGLSESCRVVLSPFWNQTDLLRMMYNPRLPNLPELPAATGKADSKPRCVSVVAPAVQPAEWPRPVPNCPGIPQPKAPPKDASGGISASSVNGPR